MKSENILIEKSAGAIVFYPGERIEYLLLLSTYWGFPKGRIEKKEDERTAALREVREETGLEVAIVEGWREADDYWYQLKGQRVHKQAVFFIAQAPSRESKISWEHEDMAWLTFEAALDRLKFDNLRQLLTGANAFIEKSKT
ncbi:MAG: bis(5'-nucleosyl)-tetraphosphatase [Acidobacteriota bacterium]